MKGSAPWGQYAQGGRKLTCPRGKSTGSLTARPRTWRATELILNAQCVWLYLYNRRNNFAICGAIKWGNWQVCRKACKNDRDRNRRPAYTFYSEIFHDYTNVFIHCYYIIHHCHIRTYYEYITITTFARNIVHMDFVLKSYGECKCLQFSGLCHFSSS